MVRLENKDSVSWIYAAFGKIRKGSLKTGKILCKSDGL